MSSVSKRVLRKIRGTGRGAVFVSMDFLDLGSRDAVDQALSRLANSGVIDRLKPGLYHYPRISKLLGMSIAPSQDRVAAALARSKSSRILLSGARAANRLGLSSQVPAKNVYLSDGLAGSYEIGNQTIVFRRVTPKKLVGADSVSGTVLQALRYLGRDGVDDAVISKCQSVLSDSDKMQLAKDARYVSGWMQPIVEQIVLGVSQAAR